VRQRRRLEFDAMQTKVLTQPLMSAQQRVRATGGSSTMGVMLVCCSMWDSA
jgi:hypothetical protein